MTLRALAAPGRLGYACAATVLAVFAATGAGVSAVAADSRQAAASAALTLRATQARGAVDGVVQRYTDTMHDLVATVATGPAGTASPALARLVDGRLPGAHQVLLVDPDSGVVDRRTVDGSNPSPQSVLRPDPQLAQAMRLARHTGRLVVGEAHPLAADDGLPAGRRQAAFELVAAVPADPDFRGWVIVSVRADDLLAAALRGAGVTGTAELTATASDGTRRQVARWSSGGPTAGGAAVVPVAVAGHDWQLAIRSDGTAPDGLPAGPPLTGPLFVGLFCAGLFLVGLCCAGLVLALAAGRKRARQQAERCRRDAARARSAERLWHEREAELVGFTAMASDGLHTPLSNVAGFTELLADEAGPGLDAAALGFLDRIRTSTQRMLTLVEELRSYTAATEAALRLQPVDTAALAAEVIAGRVAGLADERPSIDVGPLPVVTADPDLLRLVLDALVANALRFVRHGSIAQVSLGARRDADGWWRFEVADRGIGIPDEQRRKIFTPFHRAPAAEGFPGNGLGLATCRRIVDLHGGDLDVRANPGGGSIFTFTVAGTDVALPAGAHAPVRPGPG